MEKDKGGTPKKPEPKVDFSTMLKAKTSKMPSLESTLKTKGEIGDKVNWKYLFALAAIVIVVAVIAYANSVLGQMVFNDSSNLAFLNKISDWDVFWDQLWAQAFTVPLSGQWLNATYAWDAQSEGLSTGWFHTVNICLHICACLYFFFLVFRVARHFKAEDRLDCDPYQIAFAAAVLFACHPLASESVSYISGRISPLLTSSYFLCLNLFLFGYWGRSKSVRFWSYAFFLLFLGIGVLTGPDALTIPVAALALAFLLKSPGVSVRQFIAENGILLAVLVLLSGCLPYLALKGMVLLPGNGSGLPVLPAQAYYASQFKALATYYLRLFVVPIGLCVDPPLIQADGFGDLWSLFGVVIFLALAYLIFALRSRPILSFAIFLLLIGLIPQGLIIQPELASDRRFYLSLAGLCLVAGWGIAKLAVKSFRKASIACGVIVLVLAGLTIWRNVAWSSDGELWKATLHCNRQSARAHAMLALDYMHKGDVLNATLEAKKSIHKNRGQSATAFLATAAVLLHEKDYQGSRDAFGAALDLARKQKLDPEIIDSCLSGLAESYVNLGQPEYAVPLCQEALNRDPENARLHLIAGKCLLAAHAYDKAMVELQDALKRDATLVEAWRPMAEAAIGAGKPDVAYGAANMCVLKDKSTASTILLARADLLGERYDEAAQVLKQILDNEPENKEALVLACFAQAKLGNLADARDLRARATKLDPDVFAKIQVPIKQQGENQTGSGSKKRHHHRR